MAEKPVILVTGANGQLGKEIRLLEEQYPAYTFMFLSREDMPIHHFELVRNVFKGSHPRFLINCAAYTAVDKAESEKDLAFQVNAESAGVLAAVCREYNTRFIHISTDYVFDGNGTRPYLVNDPVNPQSVYGASKLEGEIQAMEYNPESLIIRTSWVYSVFGKNFVKTMLKFMAERDEISVVNDQFGCPTYAADLAEVIMQIISSGKWEPGIYHYSNTGIISWFDFACAIKEISGLNCRVKPIPGSQYPTPAKRPAYSALDISKILTVWGLKGKEWKSRLEACIRQLKY